MRTVRPAELDRRLLDGAAPRATIGGGRLPRRLLLAGLPALLAGFACTGRRRPWTSPQGAQAGGTTEAGGDVRRLGWWQTGAAVLHGRVSAGGWDRTYRLYVPASYDAGRPAPLVFVLHGGGGSGDGI